jgi:hypothetical protein
MISALCLLWDNEHQLGNMHISPVVNRRNPDRRRPCMVQVLLFDNIGRDHTMVVLRI